jgi:arsenate reductase
MSTNFLIHNPNCSKSRLAKEILEKENITFVIVDYLQNGLKEKMLEKLPTLLGLSYQEMVRKNEEIYVTLALDKKELTAKEWIQTILENPILLERPIFIKDNKAIIARPVELIREFIS